MPDPRLRVLARQTQKIEDYTFSGSGLESIAIPDSVWYIGDEAFRECTHLETIGFGTSVTQIDVQAFYGCTSIRSVVIPKSVSVIMPAVFGGCDGLQSLVVDEENERYSSRNGCNAIFDGNTLWQACPTTVIPSGVTHIGWAAYMGFGNIDTLIIPEDVISIDREVFAFCSNMSYISLPNSLVEIDDNAFYRCHALEEVSIGSGITQLGRCVFDSTACHTLHIGAAVPPSIDSTTLRGLHPAATIYVPCDAGLAYRNATYWSNYTIAEESCGNIPEVDTDSFQIKIVDGHIIVEGCSETMIRVFDLAGREIRNNSLPIGVYLVKIGNHAAQKVVVTE